MNASSCKAHHSQPRNPFRTPQQRDDAAAIMSNPVVRVCYIVAVGALVIAVSIVAYTTYSQLPSALTTDPHRLTGGVIPSVATDLKILQPEPRSRTTNGAGSNNNNVLRSLPDARLHVNTGTSDKPLPNVRTRDHGRGPEEENETYQDQEDESDDDDEEEEAKAPDDLAELRPGDSHAKMLGETKDQVKLEMDQEGQYSDHVFGVALPEEASEEESQKKLADQASSREDLVILLPRKSEALDLANGNGTTFDHLSEDVIAEN